MEAREVCKALPEGIRYGLETLGTPDEALALAATDLDTFMRTPSSEEAVLAAVVTMARMHAATLRDRFVPLGTKHNCLSLIRGIEKGQILELQSEIRTSKRRDPANALVGGCRTLRRRSRWGNPAARMAEGGSGEVTQPGVTPEHPKIGVKGKRDSRHSERKL